MRSQKLADEFKNCSFEESFAQDFIQKAGGTPHPRPNGIPSLWEVSILPNFVFKYVNRTNRYEYIKVIRDNPEASEKDLKITYHHRDLVKKDKNGKGVKDQPTRIVDSI